MKLALIFRRITVFSTAAILSGAFVVALVGSIESTALAGKGGKGGDGDTVVPTVQFNGGFDDIQGDLGNAPYQHDKKAKVSVTFSSTPQHLTLKTNSSAKVGVGRSLVVDFGTPVTLAPGTANEMAVSSTSEALASGKVTAIEGNLHVGAFQDSFDFYNMTVNAPDYNVNLSLRLFIYFTDGSNDSLLIRLAPNVIDNNRHSPSSDDVTVTLIDDGTTSGVRKWTVATQPVVGGASISRSGEGEFLDANLLWDVQGTGLQPGHIALSFGFTVTAAP